MINIGKIRPVNCDDTVTLASIGTIPLLLEQIERE